MDERFEHLMMVLGHLLRSTEELARCEEDPEIDVPALTRECRDRLTEVQQIMPFYTRWGLFGSSDGSDETIGQGFESSLRKLDLQTERCIEALTRCRDRTDEELSALRQARKAVKAYTRSG